MSVSSGSKNYFLDWFQQNGNFLDKKLTTKEWDQKASEHAVKKAVENNKKARAIYSYLDNKIILQHARLVDYILTEAFKKFQASDFENPSGFAQPKKASPEVVNFFKVRTKLEDFIRQNIFQHPSQATQLQAFQRWLTIAEMLRQQGCYEGVNVVVGVLIQSDIKLKLVAHLTDIYRNQFLELETLIAPLKAFQVLRKELAKGQKPYHDLPCILMLIRDLTGFSEVLGENQSEIGPKHSSFQQLAAKQKLIQGILNTQTRPLPWFPNALREVYEKIVGKKDNVVCNPAAVGEDEERPALKRERDVVDLLTSNTKGNPCFWQSVVPEEKPALGEGTVLTSSPAAF
ncbi:RasGEF domain [Legionella donaldsonii]|uniref:RasGEF domain n=1 Tax=Legionella donaldsonii TaxID=45060 RepID=A0A378JBY2_9GAMM|nr:RasGEF domain-containing protein [Legionella donaldsonii]STX42120.1 RasGEF domain [Legionella donaldsonii]